MNVTLTQRPKSAGLLKAQEKLISGVEGAMAEFDGTYNSEDPEAQAAFANWKVGLESHVAELRTMIMEPTAETLGGEKTMSLSSPQHQDSLTRDPTAVMTESQSEFLINEVSTVRSIGHELEADRTGREVEDVASQWADPEEVSREIADLQRARRQIRVLFGNIAGSLPETANTLRVNDLLGEAHSGDPADVASPGLPSGSRNNFEPGQVSPPRSNMVEAGYLEAAPPLAPYVPEGPAPGPSPRLSRPGSGATDRSADSATNSSVSAWNSPGDPGEQRRHAERKAERKPRKHGEQRTEQREMKRDDGSPPMPSSKWNWAEEVVKASLDPGNQWEFQSVGNERAAGGRDVQQWEQPRKRAADVASKTRERAEEVMRSERDRNRNFDGSQVAAYR